MRRELLSRMQKGQRIDALIGSLKALNVGTKPIAVTADDRAVPYLDHTVVGWTDGPPGSNVQVVFSGEAPGGRYWRRFTISRAGPGRYEINIFPTPFNNPESPLSPGIPPGASKRFS